MRAEPGAHMARASERPISSDTQLNIGIFRLGDICWYYIVESFSGRSLLLDYARHRPFAVSFMYYSNFFFFVALFSFRFICHRMRDSLTCCAENYIQWNCSVKLRQTNTKNYGLRISKSLFFVSIQVIVLFTFKNIVMLILRIVWLFIESKTHLWNHFFKLQPNTVSLKLHEL